MLLQVSGLGKSFQCKRVLHELSFALPAHQTLGILGKSGCGKTTLLKVIAGLLEPDSGVINVNGSRVNAIPPHKRGIVYLYQEALLFPHLNVFENIAFGLTLRKEHDEVIRAKTHEMIASLELSEETYKMPQQLSGGQKQRVAFGRALIVNPLLLLLDEPFGSLDTVTREAMQKLLRRVAKQFQITSLFVTHDLKEALLIGDQIGYMENGKLEIYETIAQFMNDRKTGVQNEINFGENLKQANHENGF